MRLRKIRQRKSNRMSLIVLISFLRHRRKQGKRLLKPKRTRLKKGSRHSRNFKTRINRSRNSRTKINQFLKKQPLLSENKAMNPRLKSVLLTHRCMGRLPRTHLSVSNVIISSGKCKRTTTKPPCSRTGKILNSFKNRLTVFSNHLKGKSAR